MKRPVDYDNPYPLVYSSSDTDFKLTGPGKNGKKITITAMVHMNPIDQQDLFVFEDGTNYPITSSNVESVSKCQLPTKTSLDKNNTGNKVGEVEAGRLVLFQCQDNEVSREEPSLTDGAEHSFSNKISEEENLETAL